MRVLTVDTSGRSVVGLVEVRGGVFEEIAALRADDARHHVESLAPMVERVMRMASTGGGAPGRIPDAIVVGTGPAAFTGLRAGLVTARVLARGWKIPAYGVSSLEALALAAAEKEVLAAIDARRGELFVLRARAGADGFSVLCGPGLVKPGDLPGMLEADPAVVATPDPGLYPELSGAVEVECAPVPMARLAVCRLRRSQAGEEVSLGTEPQYLRRPDVHGAK